MLEKHLNRITRGDCLKLLRAIPDGSIDMVFADPPFNLKKKYNGYIDNLAFDEYIKWCEKWLAELVRVAKPSGSIFVHNIPKWLSYYAAILNRCAHFKHWIAWHAPTSPMGKSLQPAHYGVLFYVKDLKLAKIYEIRMPHERERRSSYLRKDYGGKKAGLHPFGPLVSDVWTDIHRIKHKKYRDDHPCQLPVSLLERLILMATDEGDVVLDPFVGAGTTAVAAKKLGRNYIGFDVDAMYKKISEANIKNAAPDSKIGGVWVSLYLNEVRTLRDNDWPALAGHFEIPADMREIDYVKIAPRSHAHLFACS